LARKLEEAVLVWQVERHVPKERIIRLYLNCIEYGPKIYGIRRAARIYFKTAPSGLKPIEAAYIMNIKPSPLLGYRLFKNGALTPFWRERSQMIKRKLLRSGRITQEQADEMTPESLYDRFKPKEEEAAPEIEEA
jgi:membrane peptidoglycan carboxypeptidase